MNFITPSIYSIPPLVAVILFTVMGFFVFTKNKTQIKNRLFLLTCIFTVWWQLSWFFLFNTNDDVLATFLVRFGYVGIIFIPTVFFHFILVLLPAYAKKSIDSFFIWPSYAISAIFAVVLLATDYIVDGYSIYFWGFYPKAGQLHFLFLIFLSILSLRIVYILFKNIHLAKEDSDHESVDVAKILLFGVAFYIIASIDFLSNYGVEIYPMGALFISIFLGIIAYTIVRYRFLNVKTFATQMFAFFISAITFVEIFISESVIEYFLRALFFATIAFAAYLIVRSVRKEVMRKDELQTLSDKLARANDELRKLDVAKSEFISIASHQLRTPLTAIKGYISLILEGSYGVAPPKISDALNKVYLANERLIQLVEDLLNISRIESGRLEYKFEPSSMVELVQELEDSFILRAQEKGFTFDIDLPQSMPLVEMDYSKIREVISNLIDNSIKYTKKGGVRVRIEEKKDIVRITVSDTGIGIPDDILPQLFNKFSRGDTDRLHADGTGLGLYVGKNLVEAHGGKIWAESDGSGQGSRFIVELPMIQPRQFSNKLNKPKKQ